MTLEFDKYSRRDTHHPAQNNPAQVHDLVKEFMSFGWRVSDYKVAPREELLLFILADNHTAASQELQFDLLQTLKKAYGCEFAAMESCQGSGEQFQTLQISRDIIAAFDGDAIVAGYEVCDHKTTNLTGAERIALLKNEKNFELVGLERNRELVLDGAISQRLYQAAGDLFNAISSTGNPAVWSINAQRSPHATIIEKAGDYIHSRYKDFPRFPNRIQFRVPNRDDVIILPSSLQDLRGYILELTYWMARHFGESRNRIASEVLVDFARTSGVKRGIVTFGDGHCRPKEMTKIKPLQDFFLDCQFSSIVLDCTK